MPLQITPIACTPLAFLPSASVPLTTNAVILSESAAADESKDLHFRDLLGTPSLRRCQTSHGWDTANPHPPL
jgi:hypothetical protein